MLVDTHLHLDAPAFDDDRDDVVNRASAAGVARMLTVGVDLVSSTRAVELARSFEGVAAAVGVHPSEADHFDDAAADIDLLLGTPEVRAVGEIGLDYYRCEVPREPQLRAFIAQLEMAAARGLPVVIHDREAHDDVLHCLEDTGAHGVLHCFSGDVRMADRAIRMDLFISLAGNVTYPRAADLHDVARYVPLSSLLVETDSPYLSPQPFRGRRNEPAQVTVTAQAIADLRGESIAAVAEATSANAARLFGWNIEVP